MLNSSVSLQSLVITLELTRCCLAEPLRKSRLIQDTSLWHAQAIDATTDIVDHEHHVDADNDEDNTSEIAETGKIVDDNDDNAISDCNDGGIVVSRPSDSSDTSSKRPNSSKRRTAKTRSSTVTVMANPKHPKAPSGTEASNMMAASKSPMVTHGATGNQVVGGLTGSCEASALTGQDSSGGSKAVSVRTEDGAVVGGYSIGGGMPVTGGDSSMKVGHVSGGDFGMEYKWNMGNDGNISDVQLVRGP
jgi:hypothetical protein